MEKEQSTFWRVLSLLSRPLPILSIALLWINDWILRIYWPSWFTGKIGDLAWLFFFPLVIALPLSIIPFARKRNHGHIIKLVSILSTGIVFTLAKTLPFCNQILNDSLNFIFGFNASIRVDPTDLLALISLLFLWRFWDINSGRPITTKYHGWVWLQIAVILTIANSPAIDYGIDSIGLINNQVVAFSSYEKFSSDDGGLTWVSEYAEPSENVFDSTESKQVKFEYSPGEIIKISKDGGETFPFEYSLIPVNQPLRLKYEERRGSPVFRQGPLDAVFDPISGNTLFAMGHEGILIFTEKSEWLWVSVGDYQRITYDPGSEFFTLLFGEFLIAILFGFLIVNTFTFRINKGWVRKALIIIGWLVFIINVTYFPPALFNSQSQSYYSFQRIIFYIIQMFWIILYLFLGILDLIKLSPNHKPVIRKVLILGAVGMVIFITPYLFWSFNILPIYAIASTLATLIGIIMIIIVYVSMINTIDDYSKEIQAQQVK